MNGKNGKNGKNRSATRQPETPTERYCLRLFVTGQTPRSLRSIANLRKLCDRHLRDRYDLEIVDIYQQPSLATENQIIAAPTLLKTLPLPLRRLVGDFSNSDRVIIGLDLKLA